MLKLAAAGTDGEDSAATAPVAEAAEETPASSGTDWLGPAGIALGLARLIAGMLAYRRANSTGTAH